MKIDRMRILLPRSEVDNCELYVIVDSDSSPILDLTVARKHRFQVLHQGRRLASVHDGAQDCNLPNSVSPCGLNC